MWRLVGWNIIRSPVPYTTIRAIEVPQLAVATMWPSAVTLLVTCSAGVACLGTAYWLAYSRVAAGCHLGIALI